MWRENAALRKRVAELEAGLREALPLIDAGYALANNEFLDEGGRVVDLRARLLAAYHGVDGSDLERLRSLAGNAAGNSG